VLQWHSGCVTINSAIAAAEDVCLGKKVIYEYCEWENPRWMTTLKCLCTFIAVVVPLQKFKSVGYRPPWRKLDAIAVSLGRVIDYYCCY